MRDAAGDSGEFYIPRPVVRYMVETTAPKLGETVLDPACGTGGFLVEAFTHLERQADTVEKLAILQDGEHVEAGGIDYSSGAKTFGGESMKSPSLVGRDVPSVQLCDRKAGGFALANYPARMRRTK